VTVKYASKRVIPFLTPILFAVFPLLAMFAQNQSEVELNVLWWPVLLCVAGTVAVYLLFLAVTRSAVKAGLLASLVALAFFYYGLVPGHGSGWFTALWLGLLAAGIVVVLRTRRELVALTAVLGIAAAAIALPQVASIAIYHGKHPAVAITDPRLWPAALEKPPATSGPLPDIYVIVPDDYERADVLAKYFGYDNSEFERQLAERGFVFSRQSRSPYSDSESNIASLVNMDYLSGLPRILGGRSKDVRPVKRIIEDNRAARLLASVGYDYVHIDTDEVTFAGGNPHISPLAPPDSFANLWLRRSILHEVGGPVGFSDAATHARFRRSIESQFARLDALHQGARPKFVVFHTLLPHDPYVFDAQGRPVEFPGHSDQDLSSDTGRAYYVRQLEHLNSRLLRSIDRIKAAATTPPVIALVSDEGFSADPELFGEAATQQIRFKGLSAFSFPGLGPTEVPEPPNTVNVLRFVFNRYLGTHYELLKSASYPEGDLPYDWHEVPVT
jgi:hypothetical protein